MRLIGKDLEMLLKMLKRENLKFTISAYRHIVACEQELSRLYILVHELSEENRKLKEKIDVS